MPVILYAFVYILCLHLVVSHEHTFITIASHNHLLRLNEQTELFCKVIHNKHESGQIKSWNDS